MTNQDFLRQMQVLIKDLLTDTQWQTYQQIKREKEIEESTKVLQTTTDK